MKFVNVSRIFKFREEIVLKAPAKYSRKYFNINVYLWIGPNSIHFLRSDWSFFSNKMFHQNKICEMFKSIPPIQVLHKNGCDFPSELEIIESFATAISGISMKKVTELLSNLGIKGTCIWYLRI